MLIRGLTRDHLEYEYGSNHFRYQTPHGQPVLGARSQLTAGIILVVFALGVLIGVPILWGSTRIASSSPAPVVYGWFALLTVLMLGALVYAIIVAMSIPL